MSRPQEKAQLSFHEGILSLKFMENVIVEVEDVIYIYCYGIEQSQRKPFGVLFDTTSKHELSEEAMTYLIDSNYLGNVIAMAYISRDLISKIRLKLLLIFERPKVKIKIFEAEKEAAAWLKQQVKAQTLSQ